MDKILKAISMILKTLRMKNTNILVAALLIIIITVLTLAYLSTHSNYDEKYEPLDRPAGIEDLIESRRGAI